MVDGKFTAKERAYLASLPAVESVSASHIRYADSFRIEVMCRYNAGESPAAIFREAGLDRGFGAVFEQETRDFVITREDLVVRERKHRAAAALAGFDLELALCGRPDNEVLQQPMGCDAGLELGICCRITVTADIAGRLNELVQRD